MTDGLEGVIAAETRLSMVDGLGGRLVIRGHDVESFADGPQFERVLALLWDGLVPAVPSTDDLGRLLGAARAAVFDQFAPRLSLVGDLSPMDALRALVAQLPDGDDLDTALQLVAAPAVFTPALARVRSGKTPIAPEPEREHAADMLAMLGRPADERRTRALAAYMAVVSDHGLNASTFAARVVASTRAGLTSAVTAGLGALKGPLHGGAPGPVIDMLDAIGTADLAEAWLEAALNRGERLMGFGHRIYRVRDPRADALKWVIMERLGAASSHRIELAHAVETVAIGALRRRKPDRPLDVNVEFYTALLLEELGFARDDFTCVFAAGRVAGWIAHAAEQVAGGRLIRPQSRYIGPVPSQAA
jgi:citrate synthase